MLQRGAPILPQLKLRGSPVLLKLQVAPVLLQLQWWLPILLLLSSPLIVQGTMQRSLSMKRKISRMKIEIVRLQSLLPLLWARARALMQRWENSRQMMGRLVKSLRAILSRLALLLL
jgi:hypothetical protein